MPKSRHLAATHRAGEESRSEEDVEEGVREGSTGRGSLDVDSAAMKKPGIHMVRRSDQEIMRLYQSGDAAMQTPNFTPSQVAFLLQNVFANKQETVPAASKREAGEDRPAKITKGAAEKEEEQPAAESNTKEDSDTLLQALGMGATADPKSLENSELVLNPYSFPPFDAVERPRAPSSGYFLKLSRLPRSMKIPDRKKNDEAKSDAKRLQVTLVHSHERVRLLAMCALLVVVQQGQRSLFVPNATKKSEGAIGPHYALPTPKGSQEFVRAARLALDGPGQRKLPQLLPPGDASHVVETRHFAEIMRAVLQRLSSPEDVAGVLGALGQALIAPRAGWMQGQFRGYVALACALQGCVQDALPPKEAVAEFANCQKLAEYNYSRTYLQPPFADLAMLQWLVQLPLVLQPLVAVLLEVSRQLFGEVCSPTVAALEHLAAPLTEQARQAFRNWVRTVQGPKGHADPLRQWLQQDAGQHQSEAAKLSQAQQEIQEFKAKLEGAEREKVALLATAQEAEQLKAKLQSAEREKVALLATAQEAERRLAELLRWMQEAAALAAARNAATPANAAAQAAARNPATPANAAAQAAAGNPATPVNAAAQQPIQPTARPAAAVGHEVGTGTSTVAKRPNQAAQLDWTRKRKADEGQRIESEAVQPQVKALDAQGQGASKRMSRGDAMRREETRDSAQPAKDAKEVAGSRQEGEGNPSTSKHISTAVKEGLASQHVVRGEGRVVGRVADKGNSFQHI